MSEPYVIVHRSYDPIQAELLGDILRENGIAARVLGTRSAALVGVAQHIMQMHIEVPESQAGQATDFLEDFFQADGEALLEREGAYGDEPPGPDDQAEPEVDAESAAATPLRPLFAAGSVVLIVGMSHVYSRRLWTALMIAGGQLWAIRVFVGSTSWAEVVTGTTILFTLLAFDLVGGQIAVRAHNRGERRGPVAQLAIGAALVGAALAIGGFAGPRVPEPESRDRYYDTAAPYHDHGARF
jgi:hypothetical protein